MLYFAFFFVTLSLTICRAMRLFIDWIIHTPPRAYAKAVYFENIEYFPRCQNVSITIDDYDDGVIIVHIPQDLSEKAKIGIVSQEAQEVFSGYIEKEEHGCMALARLCLRSDVVYARYGAICDMAASLLCI